MDCAPAPVNARPDSVAALVALFAVYKTGSPGTPV